MNRFELEIPEPEEFYLVQDDEVFFCNGRKNIQNYSITSMPKKVIQETTYYKTLA